MSLLIIPYLCGERSTKQQRKRQSRRRRIMDELLYKEYSVSEKLAMYSEIRKAIAGETMNLSDAQWQELREYLDWTENNFVSRLTAEHPQLSDKALKLCMLVRLRLTDSMLAHIFHVSETSIKQRLQRMKKALGIEGKEGLYACVHC